MDAYRTKVHVLTIDNKQESDPWPATKAAMTGCPTQPLPKAVTEPFH